MDSMGVRPRPRIGTPGCDEEGLTRDPFGRACHPRGGGRRCRGVARSGYSAGLDGPQHISRMRAALLWDSQ